MKVRRLGTSGLKVSEIGLGCNNFGQRLDLEATRRVVHRALDLGITLFDTADGYGNRGGSETQLGEVLGAKRRDIVLATKFGWPMDDIGVLRGGSRRYLMRAVEDSLRRLKTDWIDLYQFHTPDPETPLEETLRALDDLVRQGKVRYVGCSNFLAYRLAKALGRSETLGLARFDSIQPRYNLLFREFERELFPLCAEERVGVIPYNPIAGGMLSGKHRRGAPTEGTRFTLGNASQTYQDRYWHDREFDTVAQLTAVADELGTELVTLAVAWVLANPVITSPIIGASRPEQLDASVAALDLTLDADVKRRLDDLTADYRRGDAVR